MTKERKKLILLFLIINLSVLSIAFIYNLLFKNSLIYDCVFLSVFGLYCPGCGGSRSLNALLKFDFLKSFIYYPPILITSLILLYTDFRIIVSIVKNDTAVRKLDYRLFLIIPISIIIQFLVKNILLFFGIDLLGSVL